MDQLSMIEKHFVLAESGFTLTWSNHIKWMIARIKQLAETEKNETIKRLKKMLVRYMAPHLCFHEGDDWATQTRKEKLFWETYAIDEIEKELTKGGK